MKYFLLVILCAGLTWNAFAQDDSTATIDVLRAPVSPAANLLGIANSQIEKPSDPTAFMTSLYQSSGGFSALPNSFAIDIAPAWVFKGRDITINKFLSSNPKYSIPQSFVISLATKSVDSLGDITSTNAFNTKFAVGIKLSILRGDVDEATTDKLMAMRRIRNRLARSFSDAKDSVLNADSTFVLIKAAFFDRKNKLEDLNLTDAQINADSVVTSLRIQLMTREVEVMEQVKDQLQEGFAEAKSAAEDLKFARYGFKLDFSAGLVIDFPHRNYDSAKYTRSGVWLTGGWDFKSGLSMLFIARYQYNPDKVFADPDETLMVKNISTFDGGARIVYSNTSSPFACSAEAIYRSVLTKNTVDPTWRISVNAEYDIGKNKKLTFIFGRDFDGTITKDGNLIAALNLLLGFGSKKTL